VVRKLRTSVVKAGASGRQVKLSALGGVILVMVRAGAKAKCGCQVKLSTSG